MLMPLEVCKVSANFRKFFFQHIYFILLYMYEWLYAVIDGHSLTVTVTSRITHMNDL